MTISPYNILISLRLHLMKTGYPCVIRRDNWKQPEEDSYFTLIMSLSTDELLAKNNELINERMLLVIGTHSKTEHQLEPLNRKVRQMIRYESIDLLDDKGEVVGAFSFQDGIVSENHITDDTQGVQNEYNINRRYFEGRVRITHIFTNM